MILGSKVSKIMIAFLAMLNKLDLTLWAFWVKIEDTEVGQLHF